MYPTKLNEHMSQAHLTKYEYFFVSSVQGLLASGKYKDSSTEDVIYLAKQYADKICEILEDNYSLRSALSEMTSK